MQEQAIEALLRSLREQALAAGTDKLGSHQLNAHWSLAYACGQPPQPWEVYRVPVLHLMPATDFYHSHAEEIQATSKPKLTWELLRVHAVDKIALEAGMTEGECKAHAFPGKVQYYEVGTRRWLSVDVPAIRWFDGREVARESFARTKDERRASVNAHLTGLRKRAAEDPSSERLNKLRSYERFVAGQFKVNLRNAEAGKQALREWLTKLDATRDFGKSLFTLLRETENEVRAAHGIAAIGESWVSETELLYRVRQLLPGIEVIAHGQPKWLGRQHLDIWIPEHAVGIEYHGLQHFQSVEFFGGEKALQSVQERDKRKRALCEKNGLRLVEITYDQDVDDATLRVLISKE
jgi:hypothetical protein